MFPSAPQVMWILILATAPHGIVNAQQRTMRLTTEATIAEDNMIYNIGDVVVDQRRSRLLIAASATTFHGAQGGVGVFSVQLGDNMRVRRLYWHEFPKTHQATFGVQYARGLVQRNDGAMVLIAKMDGRVTSAVALSSTGAVNNKQPVFSGDPDSVVSGCLFTDQGNLLLVGQQVLGGASATLLDDRLAVQWTLTLDNTRTGRFAAAHPDITQGHFILVGIVGPPEDWFGEHTNTLLARISETGRLLRKAIIPGGAPSLVVRREENNVPYEVMRDIGGGDSTRSRLAVALVNDSFQIQESHMIYDDVQLIYPRAVVARSDGGKLVEAWSQSALHLIAHDAKWKTLATLSYNRLSVVKSAHLIVLDEHIYSISTRIRNLKERRAAFANEILVERIAND